MTCFSKSHGTVIGFACLCMLVLCAATAWSATFPADAAADSGKPKAVAISKSLPDKPVARGILAKYKSQVLSRRINGPDIAASVSGLDLQVERAYGLVPGLVRFGMAAGTKQAAASAQQASISGAPSLDERIKALRATGLFEYVEPDWPVHALLTPSDAAFVRGDLWGLRNTGQSGGVAGIDINATAAWDVTTGSSDVIVGVVDTGIRHTHRDLSTRMWVNPLEVAGNGIDDDGNGYIDDVHGINAINRSGNALDDNDHGTHVAGTIAASANDAGDHVGVAFNVRLMALKFLAADGSGSTSDAIACIEYAVAQGVDVLNNSWGGGPYSAALEDAIAQANAAGILFIAAAGNDASNNDNLPAYPASYAVPNVVSVAAIDRRGELASFSNFGATSVDLAAPGVAIFSTTAGTDAEYDSFSGTSMATPHVSGVAALLKSQWPADTVATQVQRLLASTVPLASLQGRVATGGMVDAFGALTAAADGVLELALSTDGNINAGERGVFHLRVTDVFPILGANVQGTFGGVTTAAFADDGLGADVSANDGVYTAEIVVPNVTGGILVVDVDVVEQSGNRSSDSFEVAVVARPANDDFENRTLLSAGTSFAAGTNRSATRQPGEPLNPDVAGGRSVWWEWVAPTTATHTLSTAGSDFDTTLAVYRGTSLGNLVLVGANDDYYGVQSAVTFAATEGVSYRVQVDGYGGREGNIELNYPAPGGTTGAPVIVSHPRQITVIEGEPIDLSVTAQGQVPLSYTWYKDGMPLPSSNAPDYRIASSVEADSGSYHVRVVNALGSATSNTALVRVDRVGINPGNDAFAHAQELPGARGSLSASTRRATGEALEPDHGGISAPLASLWYRWTAPSDGLFSIGTQGSDFDTVLAAYSGTQLNALVERGFNDDFYGLQSALDLQVHAGDVLYVVVDGYVDSVGEVQLDYALNVLTVPGNDDFAGSIEIVGNTSVQGSNISGGGEPGEPNHAGVAIPLSSSWWTWVSPDDGSVEISTGNSDFDTVLAVYTGSQMQALSQVAANDDSVGLTSLVRFATSADTRYRIAVDGYAQDSGNIQLSVNFAPALGYVDNDGDGMADDWEARYGFDPGDPYDALLDADGDGIINRAEFRAGTNPLPSGRATWLPAIFPVLLSD